MLAPVGSVVPIECLRHSATCSHALIMDRDHAEVLCAFAVGGHALALWGGQPQRLAALGAQIGLVVAALQPDATQRLATRVYRHCP